MVAALILNQVPVGFALRNCRFAEVSFGIKCDRFSCHCWELLTWGHRRRAYSFGALCYWNGEKHLLATQLGLQERKVAS